MKTWREIDGWFNFEELYEEQVNAAPASGAVFVEVGSWLGKSTACLAEKIRKSGKPIKLYAVDTWRGNATVQRHIDFVKEAGGTIYPMFRKNMLECGVENLVQPMQMASLEAVSAFSDKSLDFVFIDADHEYESVKAYIAAWLPKVRLGGVLAGHDIEMPAVKRAVMEGLFGHSERYHCWVCNNGRK